MCVVCDACFVCIHAMSTLEPFVLRVCIHNSLFVCCSWHNTHALHRFSRCYYAQRIQRAHIVVICPLTTSGCSSYVANFNHVHLRIMQRFTSQRHYVSDMPNHMSKRECNGEIVGENINTRFFQLHSAKYPCSLCNGLLVCRACRYCRPRSLCIGFLPCRACKYRRPRSLCIGFFACRARK